MPKKLLSHCVCFFLIISIAVVGFSKPAFADSGQSFSDGFSNGAGNIAGKITATAAACIAEGIIQEIVLPGSPPACIVAVPWFSKLWGRLTGNPA